jgi:lysophospholipase L1-like esterase
MPMDGMIEGVHPNDYGMRFLASAFEKKIMEVWRTSKTMKTTN